jgi:hypothetical protein
MEEYKSINVDEIYFEPHGSMYPVDVLGESLLGIMKDPNVYVVDTLDIIDSDMISFTYGNALYKLEGVIGSVKDGKTWLECRTWSSSMTDEH